MHQGRGCKAAAYPLGFVHLFVFCVGESVDGNARGSVPFIAHDALSLLPCYTSFKLATMKLDASRGKFIQCASVEVVSRFREWRMLSQLPNTTSSLHVASNSPTLSSSITPSPQFVSPLSLPSLSDHFQEYHSWVTRGRKRAHGTPVLFDIQKRAETGRWAVGAGVQARRTAHPPLIQWEFEPGKAISHMTSRNHPFTEIPILPEAISWRVSLCRAPLAGAALGGPSCPNQCHILPRTSCP